MAGEAPRERRLAHLEGLGYREPGPTNLEEASRLIVEQLGRNKKPNA
ncbi:hypothetical protein [Thermus caldifontis]|nr:hypothetical protein [Thermus caldifontis]